MKKPYWLAGILCLPLLGIQAQNVNGVVLLDSLNLKVIRVWGTHQERGYACGFLMAGELGQMLNGYVKPLFGSSYPAARNLVLGGADLQIDQIYQDEAQGMVDGMTDAVGNPGLLDATDVLVGNCLLDLMGLMGMKAGMGCSSLMDWGDATLGTPLNGKAVVSRHLDWQTSPTLISNQVLVIHQPSGAGEQNWAMIGFAGMMSALSGVNNHLGVFQHVMDDFSGSPQHNQGYVPIWFAMRDALENADYNGDGNCDVQDLKASLDASAAGFADGWIISALAAAGNTDSLTALVAEIAPTAPTHTYRYNSYPDSIPGDNLYTANYQIARNDAMHFCTRYQAIRAHLGDGTFIGLEENWDLMKDWSHLSHNIQFIQFSPEAGHLKVAVRSSLPAYQNDALTFDLGTLLNQAMSTDETTTTPDPAAWPNPCRDHVFLAAGQDPSGIQAVRIYDVAGRLKKTVRKGVLQIDRVPLDGLTPGFYLLVIETERGREFVPIIRE